MSAATLEPKPPADGLPVFVANGRRRYRAVQLAKVALGLAFAGWLAALCASLIGFAPLPLPALSGADDGHAVSAVRPQSPASQSAGDATRRPASVGASGGKSSTAGRSRGDAPKGGGAARSTAGTSDTSARTSARTQPPTADVGHNGSSSNAAGSPQPSGTSPEPSAQPPPEAPAPTSTAPPSTTPAPPDSTSSPDQPASTTSPDGGGSTTSEPASKSTTTTGTTSEPASQSTTTTPDTPASGTLPG